MEVALDLLGRLRLKNCGRESKGLVAFGTSCLDLHFSISVGCGTGMGHNYARVRLRGFWVGGCEW